MQIEKGGHIIRSFEDWKRHAPPKRGDLHWKDGRSAKECARAWCAENATPAVPHELGQLLQSHLDIQDCQWLTACPEYQVRFDKLRGEPRNADVVASAQDSSGLIGISIEAKADETFDDCVCDILQAAIEKIANDQRTNAITRVQNLAAAILPPHFNGAAHLGELRYQLLTGVAGALAYAHEIGAKRAVFVVHEFLTDATNDRKHAANSKDLDVFVARLSSGAFTSVAHNKLYGPISIPGAPLFPDAPLLYLGKVSRDIRQSPA